MIKLKRQVTSMFITDLGDDRSKMVTYIGARLTGIQNTKNGKLDGDVVVYMDDFAKANKMRLDQMPGMEQAKQVVINGESLIEQRTVWRNGEQIKTALPHP